MKSSRVVSQSKPWRPNPEIAQHPERSDRNNIICVHLTSNAIKDVAIRIKSALCSIYDHGWISTHKFTNSQLKLRFFRFFPYLFIKPTRTEFER